MGQDDTKTKGQYEAVALDEKDVAQHSLSASPTTTTTTTTPSTQQQAPADDSLGLYLDWGDHGGSCFDCFNLEPCCGSPCNFADGAYCCLNWSFCAPCSMGKLLASSAGRERCAVVNHCLPYFVANLVDQAAFPLGTCFSVFMQGVTRHNLRAQRGVGHESLSIGDVLLHALPCTAPCALCQEIRSVEISDWDWLSEVREKGIHFMDNNHMEAVYYKPDTQTVDGSGVTVTTTSGTPPPPTDQAPIPPPQHLQQQQQQQQFHQPPTVPPPMTMHEQQVYMQGAPPPQQQQFMYAPQGAPMQPVPMQVMPVAEMSQMPPQYPTSPQ